MPLLIFFFYFLEFKTESEVHSRMSRGNLKRARRTRHCGGGAFLGKIRDEAVALAPVNLALLDYSASSMLPFFFFFCFFTFIWSMEPTGGLFRTPRD